MQGRIDPSMGSWCYRTHARWLTYPDAARGRWLSAGSSVVPRSLPRERRGVLRLDAEGALAPRRVMLHAVVLLLPVGAVEVVQVIHTRLAPRREGGA